MRLVGGATRRDALSAVLALARRCYRASETKLAALLYLWILFSVVRLGQWPVLLALDVEKWGYLSFQDRTVLPCFAFWCIGFAAHVRRLSRAVFTACPAVFKASRSSPIRGPKRYRGFEKLLLLLSDGYFHMIWHQ